MRTNTTISHPIGSARGNPSATVRDVQLVNRVMQNMMHEKDCLRIEFARKANAARTLQPKAPC